MHEILLQYLVHLLSISHDASDDTHREALDTLGLLRRLRVLGHNSLDLSHAAVDINLLDGDPDSTVLRVVEPAVDLPAEIKEDSKRGCEVSLEEGIRIRGTADRVQRDISLTQERKDVDEDADVGAPDSTGGPVGKFVEGVALSLPV